MRKNENIRLDAVLKSVIDNATFNAELPNGHTIVVFPGKTDRERARRSLRTGDRVRVEMSPCDMSKGRIVWED